MPRGCAAPLPLGEPRTSPAIVAAMARVGRGYDWGEHSERWAGVISQVADIGGVRVHYLKTDAAGAPRDAPPHLWCIRSAPARGRGWMSSDPSPPTVR